MIRNVTGFCLVCVAMLCFATTAIGDKDNGCAKATSACGTHSASCSGTDFCQKESGDTYCHCGP